MLCHSHPGVGVVHRSSDLADVETAIDTQHEDSALIGRLVRSQQLRRFCPGMLEALSVLPYGHETPLIRAVM